ncbi:MAG: FTR1 family protein [Myxococcaceae bacterium]|nr:FTR1 family protein [Myxococcaceae bacterium]
MLALTLVAAAPNAGADDPAWHQLVGLLQYLSTDYPDAVAGHDEKELEEQLGFATEAVDVAKQLGANEELPGLEQVRARIAEAKDPAGVSRDCAALAAAIIERHGLTQVPRAVPDLAHGEVLFRTNCAVCHGEKGDGVSELAKTMEPRPASFVDPARLATLTPYRAYNTVTFGVSGTPMPAFPSLSDAERWDLAFFVLTLAQPTCDHPAAPASLKDLSSHTNEQLAAAHGAAEVPCLRRRLSAPTDAAQWLTLTRAGVVQARDAWAAGRHGEAKALLVDADLRGLEPVEPVLRTRHPRYATLVEQAFVHAREVAQSGGDFPAATQTLLELLAAPPADGAGGGAAFWTVLLEALLIVLREGFEAVVVVGALLAVLKKMNASAQARLVHVGWVSALVTGAAVYAFGRAVLAGANREWMETLVSLGAVGLLLYAALWLNRRAVVSQTMGQLRGQMQAALVQGGGVGLFVVAYSSVLRESVETAIFLQGLGAESAQATVAGAVGGLLVLAVLWGGIRAAGFALPMQTMFKASTVVLCLTAVSLLGKGVHGLQELGVLQLSPVRGPSLEVLGLFPDGYSLSAQAVLLAALLVWWRASQKPRRAGSIAAATK